MRKGPTRGSSEGKGKAPSAKEFITEFQSALESLTQRLDHVSKAVAEIQEQKSKKKAAPSQPSAPAEQAGPKRGPGRPRKPDHELKNPRRDPNAPPKKRGRKPGSKNKPKASAPTQSAQ
jgi:hypothetical protein